MAHNEIDHAQSRHVYRAARRAAERARTRTGDWKSPMFMSALAAGRTVVPGRDNCYGGVEIDENEPPVVNFLAVSVGALRAAGLETISLKIC
jgi:hypothetical protein